LDTGGVRGLLDLFLPKTRVVTANVEPPADVLFDGKRLPFPDSSFEAVTSLDVLEHLPPETRADHLAELSRVAANTVVVSFPLGTDEHREAEQSLARWYEDVAGTPHRFLEEHLSNGLPTEPELHRLAEEAGLSSEFIYQGDFRRTNEVFRLSVRARHERRPDLVLRYAAVRLAPARDEDLRTKPTPWTNRAFVVARMTR
jgi:cyclopropane fatty-acyl-phospholipid synthase-like methyltransferase